MHDSQFAMIMDIVFCAGVDSIVHFHNGRLVTAPVAVVGRRKDGDNRPVVLPLVAFHDQLMSTRNKVQSINEGKLLCNVNSKGVPSSPR